MLGVRSSLVPDPKNSKLTTRWLDAAVLGATLMACAIALSPAIADPDLWGHVQYGRDVIRDGLPTTTTHSFTAVGSPWVNHENLAELVLAASADTIGPVGMLIAKCLLGVGMIGLILWNARRQGAGLLSGCLVSLLVSVNLAYFWTLRPQLLSFVCYVLMLTVFAWCFTGWEGSCHLPWFGAESDSSDGRHALVWSRARLRWLWFLPLILAIWTNSHGGFVAGWCIAVAYLAGRAMEARCAQGRRASGVILQFAAVAVVSALATLCNPYGWELHRWLAADLLPARPEILEWRRPEMTSIVMLPFWLMLVTFVASLLLTRCSRDVTQLAILALTAWQSFLHSRHIPFFAIAFGFWMTPHIESVLRRFNVVSRAGDLAALRPCFARAAFPAMIALYALLVFRLYNRLDQLTVDRAEYPVSAVQFIEDEQLSGKMVVTFNWAQYAIDALGWKRPGDRGVLVSFDGRYRTSYPQLIADMNFDFVLGREEPRYRDSASPAFDDQRVLEYGCPVLVLICRQQPHSVNVMFRNRDRWTLLYQDKIAQLWGRSTVFDDAQRTAYLAPSHRRISEAEQVGLVSWPAYPVRRGQQLADSRGS